MSGSSSTSIISSSNSSNNTFSNCHWWIFCWLTKWLINWSLNASNRYSDCLDRLILKYCCHLQAGGAEPAPYAGHQAEGAESQRDWGEAGGAQ